VRLQGAADAPRQAEGFDRIAREFPEHLRDHLRALRVVARAKGAPAEEAEIFRLAAMVQPRGEHDGAGVELIALELRVEQLPGEREIRAGRVDAVEIDQRAGARDSGRVTAPASGSQRQPARNALAARLVSSP
jgi:hypothetical protein